MIDIRKLKELVRLMVENELTELDLRDSQEQVTMRRPGPHDAVPRGMPMVMHAPPHMGHAHHAGAPAVHGNGAAAASSPPAGAAVADDSKLIKIESPMVGTFYASPKPDAPPFVSVGSNVTPDTVVCILEAMKIFNEIKAECSGTIQKVLVKSGQPVEFGQPLFLVSPA